MPASTAKRRRKYVTPNNQKRGGGVWTLDLLEAQTPRFSSMSPALPANVAITLLAGLIWTAVKRHWRRLCHRCRC
ncbi:hypothetical protein M440DRAFT_1037585 [Trichoderma longibrachiatum ATCC 18648]|uniref:Uncharacterized protein n=1 Tax=Trichoderma longibrachiatum ATCC 18648 TaxID=983965 RepID=A0A2T4C025_TRILO|nr:hypothetical protein M440DRAFT_1037585 [Trichoderma longibrachiatum ATCC 18648]